MDHACSNYDLNKQTNKKWGTPRTGHNAKKKNTAIWIFESGFTGVLKSAYIDMLFVLHSKESRYQDKEEKLDSH